MARTRPLHPPLNSDAIGALWRLVAQIDRVQASEQYTAVWAIYSVAGYTYHGPTFARELREAKQVLEQSK